MNIYKAITYFQLFFPGSPSFFLFLSVFLLILPLLAVPNSFWEHPHPRGEGSSDHKQFHLFSWL